MNVIYVDEYGFVVGEIATSAICDANLHKCVFYPLPANALLAGYGWRWDGRAWSQEVDNRSRTWYCACDTDVLFKATTPEEVAPPGYIECIPGVPNNIPIAQKVAKEWVKVRAERDKRLAESDWVRLKALDAGMPVPEAWLIYRQALRDITSQADPFAIVWPTVPA